MTIDEIIENEKEIADMLYDQQRSHSAYYHKQLAELLEELKFRRVLQLQCEKEFFAGYEKGKKEGYNKAIDDFVNFANTMPTVEE